MCLKVQPSKRWTAEEALKHEWFSEDFDVTNVDGDDVQDDEKFTEKQKPKRQESSPLKAEIFRSLKDYSTFCDMKKAALAVVAHQLTTQGAAGPASAELAELREAFRLIDINNSGSISLEELRASMKKCDFIDDSSLDDIFDYVDGKNFFF